ncbi:MAG: hypothetical protein JSV68_22120 [Anaerolineaceae bacterium]|nr:MAG: hypothetical protein JSV68_22120 [Anaerolineaceae bacterium]
MSSEQEERNGSKKREYEPPLLKTEGHMNRVTQKSGTRPDNEQQFDRPKHDPADGPPGQDRKSPKSRG